MEYSSRMSLIILDVHKLVNEYRKSFGREPIIFEERGMYMSEIVSDNIANANNKVDGINEQAPLCACKPECDRMVRRNPISKQWNKFAHGHRPAADGTVKLKGVKSAGKIMSFGTNLSEFNVQVLDKDTYNLKMRVKDEKTFKFLSQVSKGDKDEITVLYLEDDKLKLGLKYFRNCIEILQFKINVELGAGHLAFTVK